MLFGQNCGGAEQHDLAAARGGPERGAQGDLRLAEAYIAADQTVHGLGQVHVVKHVLNGPQLVRGFLKTEARLKFAEQFIGRAVSIAFAHPALGVNFHQVVGDFFNGLLGLFLAHDPGRAAQFVQTRIGPFRAFETLHQTHAVHRKIQLVAAGVSEQ